MLDVDDLDLTPGDLDGVAFRVLPDDVTILAAFAPHPDLTPVLRDHVRRRLRLEHDGEAIHAGAQEFARATIEAVGAWHPDGLNAEN